MSAPRWTVTVMGHLMLVALLVSFTFLGYMIRSPVVVVPDTVVVTKIVPVVCRYGDIDKPYGEAGDSLWGIIICPKERVEP